MTEKEEKDLDQAEKITRFEILQLEKIQKTWQIFLMKLSVWGAGGAIVKYILDYIQPWLLGGK